MQLQQDCYLILYIFYYVVNLICQYQLCQLCLSPAHDNVRKKVIRSNCYTIAKTSDLNFFQYAGIPFIEFINVGNSHHILELLP